MRLLIGCPVRKREWILPTWREYALRAAENASFDASFLFVVGEDEDPIDWPDAKVLVVEEPPRDDVRHWSKERLNHMVFLRNQLLKGVREDDPPLFLSLDSDILLHPQSLASMYEVFDNRPDAWAVGAKTYMAPGRDCPSYAMFNHPKQPWNGLKRKDSSSVLDVDVLMAAKLMNKSAYNVDYVFHRQGEDVGWSRGVTQAGGVLMWDGRTCSKHVMKPEKLEKIDARCGY